MVDANGSIKYANEIVFQIKLRLQFSNNLLEMYIIFKRLVRESLGTRFIDSAILPVCFL